MRKPSDETELKQTFAEYMLKNLELSVAQSQHLAKTHQQGEQFYLTAVSTIAGGTFVLIATQLGIDSILITAGALLLIGVFGIQRGIRSTILWQEELYQRVIRAGLHRYFQEFDPASFESFGRQTSLERHEKVYHWREFGRAPWKKIKIIGFFRAVQGLFVGIGFGLLISYVLGYLAISSQQPLWSQFIIPLIVTMLFITVYTYWMAKQVESKHSAVKHFYDQVIHPKIDEASQERISAEPHLPHSIND